MKWVGIADPATNFSCAASHIVPICRSEVLVESCHVISCAGCEREGLAKEWSGQRHRQINCTRIELRKPIIANHDCTQASGDRDELPVGKRRLIKSPPLSSIIFSLGWREPFKVKNKTWVLFLGCLVCSFSLEDTLAVFEPGVREVHSLPLLPQEDG